ncbi:cardiolipin synthase [Clostridium gasigenes]|uniref:Cardiolipin synthase n=1 Tax=Clostridium gasigenes TaxID=94869 RepID=A0A1H0TK53_9CLOT|nr:cardiolipin synthase [Clostridium gasigenes]MBB6624587.1 cardiolipin synthase [Clostridium gasigenes]MBU3088419.1 cardiolipin synthase [Clostridium gasigenes]MBU3133232.1 cardiolipin synthase [Clostridium gasigenes]SDP54211.1 cardiolipin synthase [Clostridium gasigenes]
MKITSVWSILIFINALCAISLIFIERREPTTTWAWLLIFLLLPGFGFGIYLIFGQNLSRQKIFREKTVVDEKKTKELMMKFKDEKNIHRIAQEYEGLVRMNYNNSGSLYTTGNKVKTYTSGEEKFKDLFEDIKNAKSFIHIEYYIFRLDNLGTEILEALRLKVLEGVEVRLLVDGMGSKYIRKKEIRLINNLGIKFAIFFPGILPYVNVRINYRNHRKIVIVDGHTGYVGGFNVGDEYINRGKQFAFWRDTHIRVQGEAVNELNKRFILDWDYAATENLVDSEKYFIKQEVYDDVGIQIVSSGPDHEEEYIKNAYMKMINDAKKSVYIQTPYLVPDEPMLEALKIASLSGVDVRLIVPGEPDHFYMEWMLSANMGELMKFGVKIYRYQKGFIHAKTIVSDSKVCSIGTSNLDIRSFKLNFEVNAFIYNDEISKQQEEIFFKDQEDCRLVTKEEYDSRSTSLKIKEAIIRLVSPIL